MDEHAGQNDAALLPDFTAHGVFDAFGRFDESRERREPIWWPPLLATQEESFAVVAENGDNDGGVGAREGQIG